MVNRRKYKLGWFYNHNGGSFFKTVKLGFHCPMIFLDKERWQPLPVVTITEENEEAMANKLFKKALMKVGLKPPANEQVGSKKLRMIWSGVVNIWMTCSGEHKYLGMIWSGAWNIWMIWSGGTNIWGWFDLGVANIWMIWSRRREYLGMIWSGGHEYLRMIWSGVSEYLDYLIQGSRISGWSDPGSMNI